MRPAAWLRQTSTDRAACPNCDCAEAGVAIWQCGSCGEIFCDECSPGSHGRACPNCDNLDSDNHVLIARIPGSENIEDAADPGFWEDCRWDDDDEE